MPLTLDEALLDSRTMYGEPSWVTFSDQMIKDWLSIGQQTVAALTLAVEKHVVYQSTDSGPLFVAGVRDFRLETFPGSGGFGLPTAIRGLQLFLNGISLPLWTAKMLAKADPRAEPAGPPQYWFQFAPVITFVPFPDTTFLASAWKVDFIYADLPAEWTEGLSVLPGGLDEMPTLYAVARMLLARKQWQRASQVYNQFLTFARIYRQRTLYRGQTSLEELREARERERHDTPRLPTMRELRMAQGGRGR